MLLRFMDGLINTNVYGGMKEGFKDMPDDLIEKEYKVKIQKIKDNEKILDSAIEKMTKDYVEEEKLLQAAAKIKEGRRNKKGVLENKDQSDIQNSEAQKTLDDQQENKTDISNPLTEEEKREEE